MTARQRVVTPKVIRFPAGRQSSTCKVVKNRRTSRVPEFEEFVISIVFGVEEDEEAEEIEILDIEGPWLAPLMTTSWSAPTAPTG